MANRVHLLAMTKYFSLDSCKVSLFCRQVVDADLPAEVVIKSIATTRSISSAWRFSKELASESYDSWFIREPHLLTLCMLFYMLRTFKRPPFIYYEVHDMPRDYGDLVTLRFLTVVKNYKLIAITEKLATDLSSVSGIDQQHIVVIPDGVDLDVFKSTVTKAVAKELLFSNKEKNAVVYTGRLYRWKGVYTLIDAAKELSEVNFYLVGSVGEKDLNVQNYAKDLPNVHILPYQPQQTLPLYLLAADVLVLPNSANYIMSKLYTSPLKMFEYMTSNTPIVASQLPAIEEILSDMENAYLVQPDDPSRLADRIIFALTDKTSSEIAKQAYSDVQKFSWENRVRTMLNKTDNEKMAH
jgi:glycosyltransferase involved in cell wall biosynthesis